MMWQTIIQEAVLTLYTLTTSSYYLRSLFLFVCLVICSISLIFFSSFFFLKLSSSKPFYPFFFLNSAIGKYVAGVNLYSFTKLFSYSVTAPLFYAASIDMQNSNVCSSTNK